MATPLTSSHDTEPSRYHQVPMPQTEHVPARPEVPLERIKASRVDFIYDVDTDVLTVHFMGRDHPSVVDPITDDVSSLIDRRTREVVGLEINRFRAMAVQRSPDLVAVLKVADIIGLDEAPSEYGSPHGVFNRLPTWFRQRKAGAEKKRALALLTTCPI